MPRARPVAGSRRIRPAPPGPRKQQRRAGVPPSPWSCDFAQKEPSAVDGPALMSCLGLRARDPPVSALSRWTTSESEPPTSGRCCSACRIGSKPACSLSASTALPPSCARSLKALTRPQVASGSKRSPQTAAFGSFADPPRDAVERHAERCSVAWTDEASPRSGRDSTRESGHDTRGARSGCVPECLRRNPVASRGHRKRLKLHPPFSHHARILPLSCHPCRGILLRTGS